MKCEDAASLSVARVTSMCKDDVNSGPVENSKEYSLTSSTEASFNENIDKETHNVNKVCQDSRK